MSVAEALDPTRIVLYVDALGPYPPPKNWGLVEVEETSA